MQVFTTGVPALDVVGTVPGLLVVVVLVILFVTRDVRPHPSPAATTLPTPASLPAGDSRVR